MPDERKTLEGRGTRTTAWTYASIRRRTRSGEQGVFHAEPYKSELLPLWGFKDAETVRTPAEALYERFLGYRADGDFAGMDVARK